MSRKFKSFSEMEGKTLKAVKYFKGFDEADKDRPMDRLEFQFTDGTKWVQGHLQNCCEDVWLEMDGVSFDQILNAPIITAYLKTDTLQDTSEDLHTTYSFYTITTQWASLTYRWVGTSNGYYSEEVDTWEEPETSFDGSFVPYEN